jgi:hypothetical protein
MPQSAVPEAAAAPPGRGGRRRSTHGSSLVFTQHALVVLVLLLTSGVGRSASAPTIQPAETAGAKAAPVKPAAAAAALAGLAAVAISGPHQECKLTIAGKPSLQWSLSCTPQGGAKPLRVHVSKALAGAKGGAGAGVAAVGDAAACGAGSMTDSCLLTVCAGGVAKFPEVSITNVKLAPEIQALFCVVGKGSKAQLTNPKVSGNFAMTGALRADQGAAIELSGGVVSGNSGTSGALCVLQNATAVVHKGARIESNAAEEKVGGRGC